MTGPAQHRAVQILLKTTRHQPHLLPDRDICCSDTGDGVCFLSATVITVVTSIGGSGGYDCSISDYNDRNCVTLNRNITDSLIVVIRLLQSLTSASFMCMTSTNTKFIKPYFSVSFKPVGSRVSCGVCGCLWYSYPALLLQSLPLLATLLSLPSLICLRRSQLTVVGQLRQRSLESFLTPSQCQFNIFPKLW